MKSIEHIQTSASEMIGLAWKRLPLVVRIPAIGMASEEIGACNVYRKDNKEYLSTTVAVRDTVQSTWHQSFRRCYLILQKRLSVSDMLARCMFTMQSTGESISVVHHILHAHSMRFSFYFARNLVALKVHTSSIFVSLFLLILHENRTTMSVCM